jgi:hypothetical protein
MPPFSGRRPQLAICHCQSFPCIPSLELALSAAFCSQMLATCFALLSFFRRHSMPQTCDQLSRLPFDTFCLAYLTFAPGLATNCLPLFIPSMHSRTSFCFVANLSCTSYCAINVHTVCHYIVKIPEQTSDLQYLVRSADKKTRVQVADSDNSIEPQE